MRSAIVKAYALGIITGGFLTAGIVFGTGPAKADGYLDEDEQAYGDMYHSAVCSVLSKYHSYDGVLGVTSAITKDGFSADSAVDIVNYAVSEYCPSQWPLLVAVGRAARAGSAI